MRESSYTAQLVALCGARSASIGRPLAWSCWWGTIIVTVLALFLLVPAPALAQGPPPLIVDADQVTYDEAAQKVEATGNVRLQYRGIKLTTDSVLVDLGAEQLAARGHVVLIDTKGRELRGEALIYNFRTDEADMMTVQALIDRVYIRSDRLQTHGDRIVAEKATLTTCNPDHPVYRVTASRIEVTPGDRIVAREASLWLGGVKLFTVPAYIISLRSPEETARSATVRLGYSNVDGMWIDYLYPYRVGTLDGRLYTKYGTETKFIVRTTLEYAPPPYTFAFTVGKNQDQNLNVYDQAELVASLKPRRLGGLPLTFFSALSVGWFHEPSTGAQSSRLQATVGLATDRIPLSPRTSLGASVSYQQAAYGIGGQQGVLRVNTDLRYDLSAQTVVSLSYGLVQVTGASPFMLDSIELSDQINQVGVTITHSGIRVGRIDTQVVGGVAYSFRDSSVIYTAGFLATTPGHVSFGVQASYNATTATYTDIDYVVAARICDCIQATLRYRQVRQQIWFEVGVVAFPEARVQLMFSRP